MFFPLEVSQSASSSHDANIVLAAVPTVILILRLQENADSILKSCLFLIELVISRGAGTLHLCIFNQVSCFAVFSFYARLGCLYGPEIL